MTTLDIRPWREVNPSLAMTVVMGRFESSYRVDPDGCWRWTAGRTGSGYGAFYPTEQQVGAHVWSYRAFVGDIAEGLVVDHLCGNRECVNPGHLELTTRGDNVLRSPKTLAGMNARKTHCIRNHPLSGENLIETPNSRNPELPPYRSCRTCTNAGRREARRAKRSA